jgi:hypothetical protein
MDDHPLAMEAAHGERSRTRTYVAVILVEALVIAGLYLFSRYFSA